MILEKIIMYEKKYFWVRISEFLDLFIFFFILVLILGFKGYLENFCIYKDFLKIFYLF